MTWLKLGRNFCISILLLYSIQFGIAQPYANNADIASSQAYSKAVEAFNPLNPPNYVIKLFVHVVRDDNGYTDVSDQEVAFCFSKIFPNC